MNTFTKYCPNVFLAKCEEEHERGDVITVTSKYGTESEQVVFNLIFKRDGFFYYSIVRADGYNHQEKMRKKAERFSGYAENAEKRAEDYYNKSNKDADWLSLGEPIHVGHYSERRHRKAYEDAWRNTGKMVAEHEKAREYADKAASYEAHANDINLSMPESIEYYAEVLKKATEYHKSMKEGTIPRPHSYALTYAKKAVNDAQRNYDIAVKLWAE